LFVLKSFAAGLIKDIPGRTYRTLARQEYDTARAFNEGWQNAFRGTSLLVVSEKHKDMSVLHSNIFTREVTKSRRSVAKASRKAL
jgi:hypothetical protein